MAGFNFYAVEEDVEGIFASLSERGDLKFIPVRSYPTADYIILKEVRTETERSLSQNRQWFIMGSFTKEPPHVRKIADDHFSVWGEYDGPLLSLTMPPLHRIENGIRELVPGNLSHPRAYWDHAITASRKVPDEVKTAYADIIKTIKLHLVRRKFDQNLWIGKHAAKELDGGKAIILSNGKWWDTEGNFFPKPNISNNSKPSN